MTQAMRGILAMLAASTIWGLSSIYYRALDHVSALEVLAHRTLWCAVLFAVILGFQGRRREVGAVLTNVRIMGILVLAAMTIAFNWFLFIHSIQTGRALQASLGYYIFPLVVLALGVFVLGERFTRWQGVAFAMAAVAVVVLTIGLGAPPWISLALASSFGLYSLLKNRLDLGPVISVFVETLILSPIALMYLWGEYSDGFGGGNGIAFGTHLPTTALLIFSGPLTAVPLVLMSYAARRINLGTLGLIQYVNPTLQFLVAVFVFGEAWTVWHAIAFPLIWIGLAIYSVHGLRQERSRNRAIRASTLS